MIRKILLACLVLGSVTGQFDDDFEEEVASTHVPRLLSTAENMEATMGQEVTFNCEVDDLGDFILLWKRGATEEVLFAGSLKIVRDDRYSIAGSSLHINSVHPKDSGEYVCVISTQPPLQLKHKLNVWYPPTVKPQPRDGFLTAKEGETVTLSCDATGNPVPTISWKHAGRNYDVTDGSTFLISNIQKSASGEYECIADNGVGDPAKAIITVEVVSAPKINAHPSGGVLVVREGEEIKISCTASGDPAPVVTWKKPGGEKAMKVRGGDEIVINEAERIHAGPYECIANNSLGIFTSAVIRVEVQFPPEIKVPNTWVHAGEGTTVNLTCTVKGDPIPTVTWKRGDGKVIHSNEHYHLKTGTHHHVLQIHHLKEEDFGRYECVASNPLSTVMENIHIIGTPQVPIFTSKPHGPHGSKFTLTWVVKSHTPIDEYSLIYRKKSENEDWTKITIPSNEESKVSHEHHYELKELMPSTTYEAVVTARNKFGWSKQSETFVFTTKHSDRIHEPNMSVETDESEETSSNEQRSGLTDPSAACFLHSSWFILAAAVYFSICFVH